MTTFTRTWSAAYEAIPADTDVVSQGALRIRNLKEDIQERLEVDHSQVGDTDDGKHKQITFVDPLGADPSDVADEGMLYTKDVSSKAELFWKDEDGNVKQITAAGKLVSNDVGDLKMWPTASPPTGWLECDGSAVSRTTYSALFAVISTTFGIGDGSTTFNLPDFQGRSPVGVGTGDATGASAWALAEKGGAETVDHTHPVSGTTSDGSGSAANATVENVTAFSLSNHDHTFSVTSGAASDTENMSPVLGIHFVIFANA